jgi:transcriptional regulator with XRE-family HTH domain
MKIRSPIPIVGEQTAGEYIGNLRRQNGMTMRQAALRVGLNSAGHWSDIEHDKKAPDGWIETIASELGGNLELLRDLASSSNRVVEFKRERLAPEKWRLVCEMYRRIDDLKDSQVVAIRKKLEEPKGDK